MKKGSGAMRKSRFSVEQIVYALKQVEARQASVGETCRKLGVSEQTFYTWKKRYAGMGAAEARAVNQLTDENRRLKQLVADLTLDKQMLQEVLAKKA
jgi:putative transposase